MSYHESEAYQRIQSAKKHLADAYADLLVVLDEKTIGHTEMKATYVDRIHQAAAKVRELKNTL